MTVKQFVQNKTLYRLNFTVCYGLDFVFQRTWTINTINGIYGNIKPVGNNFTP